MFQVKLSKLLPILVFKVYKPKHNFQKYETEGDENASHIPLFSWLTVWMATNIFTFCLSDSNNSSRVLIVPFQPHGL